MPPHLLVARMKKKSQIQIGETIAVLFVFFILVIIGFIFYAKVIKGNIESEKGEVSQLNSVGVAQRVMYLPEIGCSEDNVIIDNCADILKLKPAQDIMSQNEIYYFDILQYSSVNISQIYPPGPTRTLYSKKLDGFATKFITNVPISLYEPTTRKYGFGVLTIETMSR